jgi:hypothetical protein
VAAFCRGPAGECDHDRLPRLELSPAHRPWQEGVAPDLGQRPLAPEPGSTRLDPSTQPPSEAGEQTGVHIVVCPLPIKSPWLNPLEPHWVHGKRGVVEADGILPAWELADRVCAYFQCAHEPHLTIPEKVA